MRWGLWSRFACLATLLTVLSGPLCAQQGLDLDGRTVDPLAQDSGKIVVLVFLRRDCPVSGRYAPSIQLAEMGRFAEAKSHFERALEIDPQQPIAKENLEALKKEMREQ